MPQRQVDLKKQHYLLLKWNDSALNILLTHGMAQIWGQELPFMTPKKFASTGATTVYSLEGCKMTITADNFDNVQLIEKNDKDYPMSSLYQIGDLINKERITSRLESQSGPVIFVLAKTMLGKLALSKFLINHACKYGNRPLYIDMDPLNNMVGVKGSIAAGYCERKFPEDFFEEIEKIIFYSGNDFIPQFYKMQAMRLAKLCSTKLANESSRNSSGAVVAFPSVLLEAKYKPFILQMAEILKSQYIVIVNDIESEEYFKKDGSFSNVCSLREPTSLETGQPLISRALQYFLGSKNPIKAVKIAFRFNDIHIVKISLAVDGTPVAKQINVREHNIAKAVVAVVKCRFDADSQILAKNLSMNVVVCLAQVGSLNDKDEVIEMMVGGQGLQRSLRSNVWVYGQLSFE